jgi:hypothetical protein
MGQTTQWPKEKDRNFLKVLGGRGGGNESILINDFKRD